MIRVRYKCRCMSSEVDVEVLPRVTKEVDVVLWLKSYVTPLVAADHQARSPRCQAKSLEELKIPVGGLDGDLVGGPTQP